VIYFSSERSIKKALNSLACYKFEQKYIYWHICFQFPAMLTLKSWLVFFLLGSSHSARESASLWRKDLSLDKFQPSNQFQTQYTMKAMYCTFNEDYAMNQRCIFEPVRHKLGRIHFRCDLKKLIDTLDVTWSEKFEQEYVLKNQCFQLEVTVYRRTITRKFEPIAVRFTVNVCNIVNDGESSLLFKFIPNLYGYVKDIFQPCPWKKVTINTVW
jgi:hypothetical protein